MPHLSVPLVVAALLALAPYLTAAFAPRRAAAWVRALPAWAQMAAPSLLCLPYALVTLAAGAFAAQWMLVYALAPVAMASLARWAGDPHESARWASDPYESSDPYPSSAAREWALLLLLAVLGLSVDLRWLERAWPPHLAIFNKVLLLDAAIYALAALRPVAGTGFDLRLRLRDLRIGLREFALYLPLALALGLGLGFLHLHGLGGRLLPVAAHWAAAWLFTFFFIAVPEELFFRGWVQNLLERRIGRRWALAVTALVFGLAHFNKRAPRFNGRYVLLAAVAGVFYGRAWRQQRRVAASAVTHATVDSVWSLWFR